jgi:hypothetical protein
VTDGGAQLEKKRHAAALTGDTDSEAAGGPTDGSTSNDKITIIPFLKIIKRKNLVLVHTNLVPIYHLKVHINSYIHIFNY